MRSLHELLWYLSDPLTMAPARALHGELSLARAQIQPFTEHSSAALLARDMTSYRRHVNALLLRTSELLRAEIRDTGRDLRGADLVGANLRGVDLTGANLRGAYFIGADLRDADPSMADVTGADPRDADVRGADLGSTIFLIQARLDAASGDATTRLPSPLTRPTHWSAART